MCASVCASLKWPLQPRHPYPAPVPQQATQRDGRGKAGMTDSLANFNLLTPVLVTLICAESKHSRAVRPVNV